MDNIYYAYQFVANEIVRSCYKEIPDKFVVYNKFAHGPVCPGTTTGTIYLGTVPAATFMPDGKGGFHLKSSGDSLVSRPVEMKLNADGQIVVIWGNDQWSFESHLVVSYEYDLEGGPERRQHILPHGDLTMDLVLHPDDFSVNLVINKQLALRMRPEQWDRFVKEVMKCWVG